MTIAGDSTRVYSVNSARGIEGSTAINAIPDGFCLELENASLGQKGLIAKRTGYNIWGCELPLRCRKTTLTTGIPGSGFTQIQIDSTPVITIDNGNSGFPTATFYKNIAGKLNELVPEYVNSVTDDYYNTVICQLTNLPSDIVITTDTIFKITNGVFFSPIFVANSNTFLISIVHLPNLVDSSEYGLYYLNITDPWSEELTSGKSMSIHSGQTLPKKDITFALSYTNISTTRIALTCTDTSDLQVGTGVFFESGIMKSIGGSPTKYATQNGVIDAISGNTIYIKLASTLYVPPTGINTNYLKFRYVTGNSLKLYTSSSSNYYASYTFSALTQTVPSDPAIDTSVVEFFDKVHMPVSVNAIQMYNTSVVAAETVSYLYGTRASAGYVGLLNKFFNRVQNAEVLVCGVNGNLFEEREQTTGISTLAVPKIAANQTVTPNPITLIAAFTIPGAESYYKAGDVISRTTLTLPAGTEVTESYTVTSVTTNTVNVQALSSSTISLKINDRWIFTRTSNTIYLDKTQFTSAKLFVGQTVQIANYGKDYAHHTIVSVYPSANSYGCYIILNNSISWSSNSFIYQGIFWSPVFYGVSGVNEYVPITPSQFASNSKDLSSVSYDYALYIAAGNDGIWRYDGQELSNLRLPAPPLAYWRNISGTYGFLPTKTGEDGKTIGTEVVIRITYIYTDSLGRVYESPISPDTDITITTTPLNDGSDKAQLVEVRVPSIPTGIGFAADKIRIRAYRPFTSIANNVTQMRLDNEVTNSYNSPFTSIIVGNKPNTFSTESDWLYSEKDTLGSNRPAPLSDYVAVLNSKLVALGGSELPRFEVVTRQVFQNDTVKYSPFLAYSYLYYIKYGVKQSSATRMIFFTVPFSYKINSTETYLPADIATELAARVPAVTGCNYPTGDIPAFITRTMLPATASGGEYTIDTASGKGIVYTDTSNQFRLQSSSSLGNIVMGVSGNKAKLRLIGVDSNKISSWPINFNRDVFTGTSVGGGGASDDILLTASTKWTNSSASSLIGTNVSTTAEGTPAALFELAVTIDSNIGTTDSSLYRGGIDLISTASSTTMTLKIRQNNLGPSGAAYTALGLNKFIVIQMNKIVDGVYVEDTLGNIKVSGDTSNISFNATAIFQVTSVTPGVLATNYDVYTLSMVDLKAEDFTLKLTKDVRVTKSVIGDHGEFAVYLLNATSLSKLTRLNTASFTTPSSTVQIYLTADPADWTDGDYVTPNFYNSSGVTLPNFEELGFPNLNGSFKIIDHSHANKWIKIDAVKAPLKVASSTTMTIAGNTIGGSMINPSLYVLVDTSAKTMTVKYDAAVSTTAGDIHFLCFRGWEFNSLSSQISGWFTVKTTAVASQTIVYVYNESTFDARLNTGFKLSKMIYAAHISYGTYVPVPVPFQNALSEELYDLAWPMFDQHSDSVYTPLMGVSKRYALAMNTVLNARGFANWGGYTDVTTQLYPVNGFQFVSHMYPVNRYTAFSGGTYSYQAIDLDGYNYPYDYCWFWSQEANFYSLFGAIQEQSTTPFSDTFEVKTYYVPADTQTVVTYTAPPQGSRIWWTTFKTDKEINNQIAVFKYGLTDEIASSDGESIVGAAAYQNYLVVAKNNSLHRTTLDQVGTKIEVEKAQSTVGAVSGKNMITTESYMYFVHTSGVYYLNGLNVEPETTLNRYFDERVYQNADLLKYTAGYHDPLQKEIVIGVPYSSSSTTTTSIIDGQFVYNYNEGVFGWSVNTNIPATWWVRRMNENYFSSTDGRVYKRRSERDVTKYRDYEDAIAFRLRTRYINMDDDINFKFIRNFILQLGCETVMNVTVNYTWDYFKDTKALTIIPLSNAQYRSSPYAGAYFVSNKYLKPVRGMVEPNRVAQLGLEIINAEIDAKMEVYGIAIEGQTTNTRLVTQKNQRR